MLNKIVGAKRVEIEQLKGKTSLACVQKVASEMAPARDFKAALQSRECAIIAEIKRRSPSKGFLREDLNSVNVAELYEKHGAAAISVLTDQEFFGGHLKDLYAVSQSTTIPVLRKDFIIDPYQIYEARTAGADAILLIVSVLEDRQLAEYIELAKSLGMSSLVEIHSFQELKKALFTGAEIVGINNRDLKTFKTDLNISLGLAACIPGDCLAVSESGIHSRNDIKMLMDAGIHVFLIGEALMTASDAGMKLKELIGL